MIPSQDPGAAPNPRQRALEAAFAALQRLADVAAGRASFASDFEIRSTTTLARFAISYLKQRKRKKVSADHPASAAPAPSSKYVPKTPEQELAGRQLSWLRSLTDEESAEFRRKREEAYAEWDRNKPPHSATWQEREEHYRTQKFKNISEVDDSIWPERLRESTLRTKGGDHE